MAITDAGGPQHTPERSRSASRAPGAGLSHTLSVEPLVTPSAFVRNLASTDWIAIGYLTTLLCALALGKGPNRPECMLWVSADLAVYLFCVALVRMQVLRWGGAASSLLYRVAVMAMILASFFQLREILPAVSPYSVDANIYAFDLRVFGFEPSVVFDRFVTPVTTEWFAFFYFLYFLILSAHVLPMTFLQRDARILGRFAIGMLIMFMGGHVIYMIVPGYGPYWYLKDTFHHPLVGGTFWRLVRETVEKGGSQKDIFPSLHTAAPTYFALFSFRHRKLVPFKYTWPVVAFLCTQIIIATMFLRWHYLVDICAGLTLATFAQLFGQRVADWEYAKRTRLGLQPAWMPLAYPWSRTSHE